MIGTVKRLLPVRRGPPAHGRDRRRRPLVGEVARAGAGCRPTSAAGRSIGVRSLGGGRLVAALRPTMGTTTTIEHVTSCGCSRGTRSRRRVRTSNWTEPLPSPVGEGGDLGRRERRTGRRLRRHASAVAGRVDVALGASGTGDPGEVGRGPSIVRARPAGTGTSPRTAELLVRGASAGRPRARPRTLATPVTCDRWETGAVQQVSGSRDRPRRSRGRRRGTAGSTTGYSWFIPLRAVRVAGATAARLGARPGDLDPLAGRAGSGCGRR